MRRLKHFLNGEREVFTTFNVSQFSTVIEILKDNGISYSTYTNIPAPQTAEKALFTPSLRIRNVRPSTISMYQKTTLKWPSI